MIIATIADVREAARQRPPRFLFAYMDGGSCASIEAIGADCLAE